MSYNPYGVPPYGAPPQYMSYPGAGGPPGMAPPPGLGAPPGMPSVPGMAPPGLSAPGVPSAPGMVPPPGMPQPNTSQANRPSGLPNFQSPPTNMPNINFNARVIRLGTSSGKPNIPSGASQPGRRDSDQPTSTNTGRPGLGTERGADHARSSGREAVQSLMPPTNDEKLRTIFLHKIPDGVGGDEGLQSILNAMGRLRRWDSAVSVVSSGPALKFGFAQFEDAESLATALELLPGVEVPVERQTAVAEPPENADDDVFEGIEKRKLEFTVDEASTKYLESYKESKGEEASSITSRLEAGRKALKSAIRLLFYPPAGSRTDADGDATMGEGGDGGDGDNVEVVNITLAQEDELADIPAELREVVAAEITAFRERSNKRESDRLKQQEELDELEKRRNGSYREAPRRGASPTPNSANNVPLGPRGVHNAPTGPKGQNGGRNVAFVNGNGDPMIGDEDEDSDASDEEFYNRQMAKQRGDEGKMYNEAERKWVNRERSRAAALERERDRDKQDAESFERRRQEQLEREIGWDDEKEAARKSHLYYRDHSAWLRKRTHDRNEEAARDASDRRLEEDELRRERAEMERARGMAASFLDQQEKEMEEREAAAAAAAAAAPQPFKLSLGAAAQKNAQRAGPVRRTIAEVEGLLDDEESDQTARRQLIPIQFEPTSASASMTDEELSNAIRALAQEIPSDREGLWAWDVQWDFLDTSILRDKLQPFVEKKIVEYLGVQEEVMVEVIEAHLGKHGKPGDLVDELAEALDEAEDLVKKIWRMVIFFTECEKRGYPA